MYRNKLNNEEVIWTKGLQLFFQKVFKMNCIFKMLCLLCEEK